MNSSVVVGCISVDADAHDDNDDDDDGGGFTCGDDDERFVGKLEVVHRCVDRGLASLAHGPEAKRDRENVLHHHTVP